MFFQGLHRRNVWLSKMFKLVHVFCFICCFKTDGWDSQKNWKKRRIDDFHRKTSGSWGSSAQGRLECQSVNGVALRKKTLQLSHWDDPTEPHWIWSSPLRLAVEFFPVHSDEWHVATCRNAEIHHVLKTHPVSNFAAWYLSSTELQTALCKEGNEHRRDKCLGPKLDAKVESLSMLNPNWQAVRAEYNVDWANKCGTRWDRLENLTSQPGPVVF